MSLTQAPQRQQNSPWFGSVLHTGPSVSLRRESPMTTTLHFLLTEEVMMWGGDDVGLCGPSIPEGPLSISSVVSPGSRALYLL